MSSSMTDIEPANAVKVEVDDESIKVELDDGRRISLPVSWYPRLFHGSQKERGNYRFIGNGSGIHWPDLEEDISVQGLLAGHHSQENQSSLNKWLKKRELK